MRAAADGIRSVFKLNPQLAAAFKTWPAEIRTHDNPASADPRNSRELIIVNNIMFHI
jgi:hypothetical protein